MAIKPGRRNVNRMQGTDQVVTITYALSADACATGLARIPILVTGGWVKNGREISFSRDELETAVANFQKLANHDLNVDYDHASEDLRRAAGEPTPSAGRIVALDEPEEFSNGEGRSRSAADNRQLSVVNRYILYGRFEPTERARELIKNREYRYVSAAFSKDFPDRKTGESQGLTLTSVALTNQPFLDELPEVWLSVKTTGAGESVEAGAVSQPPLPSPVALHLSPNQDRRQAENGGRKSMAKLNLECSADGKHQAFDGDNMVGELENDHLRQYAQKHLDRVADAGQDNQSAQFAANFAREIGVEGKTHEEIRGLVTLALHPPKAEITLLCESIGADGKLDNSKLDALDDGGRISRSAWRRAKDAESRVQNAFSRGQLTPAQIQTGAPLRLALSDGAAFKTLIEDRPSVIRPNAVTGMGGSGCETGESPRQIFSRMVEEKKQQLMQTNGRMGELEAHRQASSLVAKENPDLLKNYRTDAKSA